MSDGYYAVVDQKTGKLRPREELGLADTPIEVYEALEQMYGMIWWLADEVANRIYAPGWEQELVRGRFVGGAVSNYKGGLKKSPGADKEL